jgi:hypothetical protein
LIFLHSKKNFPSFFNIKFNYLSYKNHNFDQCVCVQFKRTLKYFFKGFYDENNLQQEYVKAIEIEKIIIDTDHYFCIYCRNVLFPKIKIKYLY